MIKKPIIAIDGPAGAGKSTLAKNIARKLGLIYIDSGAMYRAFGLKCVSAGISSDNIKEINSILEKTVVEFKSLNGELKVFLDGKDITNRIRTPEAGKAASVFSAIPTVRNKMIALQRKIGAGGGVVMDGRDIGTVVFPDAEVKIFLEAGNETRAIRRYKELFGEEKEPDISSSEFQKILYEQAGRDSADTNRASSPLKPAADAVVLDSTLMTKDDVLCKVLELISERSIRTKKITG
jgi:cytidylate kinase